MTKFTKRNLLIGAAVMGAVVVVLRATAGHEGDLACGQHLLQDDGF